MLYVIINRFKPNFEAARDAVRDDHIDHMKEAGARLKMAGPLTGTGDEPEVSGSMIIIDADSRLAASLFANTDPFMKAGIIEHSEIQSLSASLGVWVD
jgi:uncharacterized protein